MRSDKTRELLKALLRGESQALTLLKEMQENRRTDLALLTANERQVYTALVQRLNSEGGCEAWTLEELKLASVLHHKAKPNAPKRHLLDRVDLTTIPADEVDTARMVVRMSWVKATDRPAWLQE